MPDPTVNRRPGKGPRAAEAIFETTLRHLAERGYTRLTIEAVAQDSGVNKTTIYRWWPSKPALLRAAMLHARVLDIDIPDTGSLRGDLIALTEQITDLLTDGRTEPVARAMTSGTGLPDDELAALTRDFFADRFSREQPVFARATARGELPENADPMLLLDLIAGAVWMRVLLRREPVPPDFARDVVDAVLPR
ncbi:TetR/AcrR family transcriptional regulator [Streptomyces sp. Ncost-T10-10d]|uniref:TetR/AcrR family transcriptional regulator n=1 Tax=Streptomyces sp. Ncost-T10-10d TaxID=1839774 RepID=UPI00081E53C9|nr:TetR/AcrR family transcriptional regulator [Streptomyces sp. Ncost-T10-10d]SCF69938.1 transcriptional regulator, TetR family [Streptomyces sp. Ncost-T10-10d]